MAIIKLVILYIISDTRPSTQHFIPPLQNCIAAEMCNHTWIPVCGKEKNTSNLRSFADECDMIEYNCDYKTDYTKTDLEKCTNNTNSEDVNEHNKATKTSVLPVRKSNVESITNYPFTTLSTLTDTSNEHSISDVTDDPTSLHRLRLLDTTLRRTYSIQTFLLISRSSPPLTSEDATILHYTNTNEIVTTMTSPLSTATETELPGNINAKTTISHFLRHGAQCTCDQQTTLIPTIPMSVDTSVFMQKKCTRNKHTTPLTTISSISTEMKSTSKNLTELSTESTTTKAVPVTNVSVTEHTSHSFGADGICTCGKHTSPLLTPTTAQPTRTSVETSTTPTSLNQTNSITTTKMIADISTTPPTSTTIATTGPTTSQATAATKTGRECTCAQGTSETINISEARTTSVLTKTTENTTASTPEIIIVPVNNDTNPVTTTTHMTTDRSTTVSPITSTMPITTTATSGNTTATKVLPVGRECTCAQRTSETITTSEPTTTTMLNTTTEPTSTTTEHTTTTESPTTSETIKPVSVRECTCNMNTATVTSPMTTTTIRTTTTTEVTTTAESPTTTEPTATIEPVFRECTCNMNSATVTSPVTTSTIISTTKSSTPETTTKDITNNEIDSVNTKATQKITCSAYPTECKRPSTWETTSKGETRDFFRILKERYGDRVKILRATTHWPLRIPKIERFRDSFRYGRHNERRLNQQRRL